MPELPTDKRLDSWKEIADYLGRDVRTVIRWEKERGLPVHRLPGGTRQPVFALASEIDAWQKEQEQEPTQTPEPQLPAAPAAPSTDRVNTSRHGRSVVRHGFKITLAVGAVALCGYLVAFRGTIPAVNSTAIPASVGFTGSASSLHFRTGILPTGVLPYRPVLADLNRDGVLDVVFTTAPASVVGVSLGKGEGTFSPTKLYEGCPSSDDLVVADFNRDGHSDVAAACYIGDSVALFMGNGDGTLSVPTKLDVPRGPRFLSVGDLENDGWPELLVTSTGELKSTLLKNHRGTFTPQPLTTLPLGAIPTFADVKQNGRSEIVAAAIASDSLQLRVYDAEGEFTVQPLRPLPAPQVTLRRLFAVDLNGDGILDLILTNWGEALSVSRGQGNGLFSDFSPLPQPSATSGIWWFTAADLDLDGRLDILTTDNRTDRLLFFRGQGDCTFAPAEEAKLGTYPLFMTVGDLNGDGKPDLIARTGYEEQYVTLLAVGGGHSSQKE